MPAPALPSPSERHLLSRFTWGVTPALVAEVRGAGGSSSWLAKQLRPDQVADSYANSMRAWFPRLQMSVTELVRASKNGNLDTFDLMMDLARWSLLRRVHSKRQVHEVMASFWSDHLHIPVPPGTSWPHRVAHDTMIRKHALGRFEDMLLAVEQGPAMGCYLDLAVSTAKRLNENLGRELLELHTVGRDPDPDVPPYDEQDVQNASLVLTGYRVARGETWMPSYERGDHYVGRVKVMGWEHANTNPDGRAATQSLLRYLARHPATARRLAHKMCVRFVSDDPSSSIVAAVAKAYTDSGTDIKAMLRAMIAHPDFAASDGQKARTPIEDAVATYRALRMVTKKPRTEADFGNVIVYQVANVGYRPFQWPRPDGPPDVADAWSSVGRILGSFHLHGVAANGANPAAGVTYRNIAAWLPPLPATLQEIVDHVSGQLLARRPSARMSKAVSERLGVPLTQRFRTFDELRDYRARRMLACLLDTPQHMSR